MHTYIRIIIVTLAILFVPKTFGYLEDRLYCRVSPAAIQVSLHAQSQAYRCQEYVILLHQQINKTAQDTLLVQSYIDKGGDTSYRRQVRDTLRTKFVTLVETKSNIEWQMMLFERNLFRQSMGYLEEELIPYLDMLENQEVLLMQYAGDTPVVQQYAALISQQIITIQSLLQATDFASLVPYLSDYIYLQQQLAGTLASLRQETTN